MYAHDPPLSRGRDHRLCCPFKNVFLHVNALLNTVLVIDRSVHECQFLGILHCFSTIYQFPSRIHCCSIGLIRCWHKLITFTCRTWMICFIYTVQCYSIILLPSRTMPRATIHPPTKPFVPQLPHCSHPLFFAFHSLYFL